MERLYLDHNAATPPVPAALAAARRVMESDWANPSSLHREGRAAREVLEVAREQVAGLAGVAAGQVVFTSGGTEAANAALAGAAWAAMPGHRRLVVSGVEHAGVRMAAAALGQRGFDVVDIPPGRDGVVPAEAFIAACTPDTAVAALTSAQGETGALQPVSEVAAALESRRLPLLVDAVQCPGRVHPVLPAGSTVIGMLSAQKLGGLAGAGALLLAQRGEALAPLLGGSQERGRRGGTPPLALIAAMGAAAQAVGDNRARLKALTVRFETSLLAACPGVIILAAEALRLPGTSAFLAGVAGEDLAAALDLEGVAVSPGAACSSGAAAPSAAVMAMGWRATQARQLVRVSAGPETSEGDMERAAALTAACVKRLRHAGLPAGSPVESA